MNALIGQNLGSYRITSQIGKGGMATVFKAYQPSLDRYVAIKVMPPYYAEQDPSFLKRFQREAKAIAALRHPNILIVMDYGEQDGTTYIVMEYVETGTLSDLMGRPMPPEQMAALIEQVAGALDYAHQAGVVHRDIKPSNILLPKPDWPLLTDFGLAKIVGGSQLTQSGTIAGTPAYMSPEQGRGDPVDLRSDIYSLGIVLYEMATGAVPFEAETPMAVVVKHIIDPLPLPRSRNPDLPEQIENVILKALAKEPRDRFQRAGEMAEALSGAVAVLPEAAATAPERRADAATTVALDDARPDQAAAVGAGEAPPEPAAPASERALEPRPVRGFRPSRTLLLGGSAALVVAVAVFGAYRLLRPGESLGSTVESTAPQAPESAPLLPADTRSTDGLIADASAKIEAGDFEGGMRDLELALQRDLRQAGQLVQIAELQLNAGDPAGAVGTIERARAVGPEDAWAHEAAGYIYRELGDYSQAAAAFERAIELEPESFWTHLALAETRLTMGEPQAAQEVTQRALESGAAEDPDLLESFGWLYLDHGMPEQAEPIFALLAERHPGDLRGAYGLAELRYELGDVVGAIEVLERAARVTPDSAAYETLGWWHWELDQTAQAQAAFERSIELDPTRAISAYGALASLLVDQDQPDQALELLRRAAADHSDQAQIHAELGHLLLNLDRPAEAVEAYEQAVARDSGNGYRYVELAAALGEAGDQQRALEVLGQAAERAAADPWLHEALGWGYAELQRCDLAIGFFARALELEPDLESATEGLANCGS